MAIGRISGLLLQDNLERQAGGITKNLAIDGNLTYFDVSNRRVGINTASPGYSLDVAGNVQFANIVIANDTISSTTGRINLGTTANIQITGGAVYDVLFTDGSGNLSFGNLNALAGLDGFTGDNIALGLNTAGAFSSNAVMLTADTTVTDGIAQINYVLGKLVPPSPPAFPANSVLSLTTPVFSGRMSNFTQTDNRGWGNLSVLAGTAISSTRVNTYDIGTITNAGPGDAGTITAYLNTVDAGDVTMYDTVNQDGTYGNLIIFDNQDYHNVISTVPINFWKSFSARLNGTNVPSGWNTAMIHDSATPFATNTVVWYYDNSAPGTPAFSNTSISLTSNSSTYSSTIPHYNSGTSFKIKGNISRLSGDTYPIEATSGTSTLASGTSGGPFATPTAVTYNSAGVTVPLVRNLYVSTGSAYFESAVATIAGFGSSAGGPVVSATNNYATGSSASIIVSGTPLILYKTGTGSLMEETNLTIGSAIGTGSGLVSRVVNPGNSDTPVYTTNASLFNSQTSTLQTYDATIVAAVLKNDVTNYSVGYLPPGPDLSSGRSADQYFTFKFVRTSVSKFNIKFSGTIAGMWVALPGSGIDTSSTLNGWMSMDTTYNGSGQPGAGTGGNGSNGCALGGVVTLNSLVTNHNKTCTFGPLSSSNTSTNEIYVRIKLTTGQLVTSLSLETASN